MAVKTDTVHKLERPVMMTVKTEAAHNREKKCASASYDAFCNFSITDAVFVVSECLSGTVTHWVAGNIVPPNVMTVVYHNLEEQELVCSVKSKFLSPLCRSDQVTECIVPSNNK